MKDLFKKVLKKLKLAMTALALIASVGVHGQYLGKCGDNAWAEFDGETRTLYIRGTGRIWDASSVGMPWGDIRYNIENVIFEEGITYIGQEILWYIANGINIYLPYTLTDTGTGPFVGMSRLRKLTIPENVGRMGPAVFSLLELDVLYCLCQTPPATGVFGWYHSWFQFDKSKTTLYVRSGSIDKYKENPEWSDFKEILPIPEYDGFKRMESISLPEKVEGKSGDQIQLTPIFKPASATFKRVLWLTNHNVATVSEDGLVTLVGNGGESKIIAITSDGGYRDTCAVRVMSNNANLKNATINGIDATPFNDENTLFVVNVPYTTESVEITAAPEDDRASVKIDQLGILNAGWNYTSIKITSESGRVEKVYPIGVYKINNDARLRDVYISDGELSPEFDPDIKNYTVTVKNNVDEITIKGKDFTNESWTVTLSKSLTVGNDTIILTSYAEDTEFKCEYTFIVHRQSNEAKLKGLSISQGSLEPAFSSHITDYTLKVSKSYGKVSISGIPAVEKATSSEHKNILIKDTTIVIKSTSEDESQNMEYRIKVKPINNNTNLQSLQVEGYEITPEFQRSIKHYKAIIKPTDKEIYIKATPEDTNATVFGNIGYSYVTGNKIIYRISVLAEDRMTESLYTITAIKEEDKYETGINKVKVNDSETYKLIHNGGLYKIYLDNNGNKVLK